MRPSFTRQSRPNEMSAQGRPAAQCTRNL
jgi:hypothetical protein